MAIAVNLNVGPQAIAAGDGVDINSRAGRTGDQIISELHGRYFEQMRSTRMFSAANQAAQAISVALATTYTGLVLYNPVGSNKLLVPNIMNFAPSIAEVALSMIGLLTGFAATGGVTAQTTPLTIQSNQIGNLSKGVGIPLSAATIVTPTVLASMAPTAATSGFQTAAPYDFGGVWGILPGGYIGFYALTAVTGFGFMCWEEVDLPL
jgi:hypothetical protein